VMKSNLVLLIARNFLRNIFSTGAAYAILVSVVLLLAYGAYSGWKTYSDQNEIRIGYQQKARESWENNPDKHPHRMAHFGSFAFRIKHPLSIFDFGLESFTGNAVYLEAHKQNTVNFSEASMSTGLLRFGEISMATVLQIVLPLVIIFIGFNAVSEERENGTLRTVLIQGANWKSIIAGKTLGLLLIGTMIIGFAMLFLLVSLAFSEVVVDVDLVLRGCAIFVLYIAFCAVIAVSTVLVSASSRSSRNALITLLGGWLVFAVILPRTTQALGSYFFPAPSKIEFHAAIEEDVLRQGDSHHPDDPHYKHLRDSVLLVHQVDSVEKLPFNYSGFVMREGEKISATIYNKHWNDLLNTYGNQNSLAKSSAWVNPFAAVRNLSMALAGTDFESYKQFNRQAEMYRYNLAQTMNEIQMKYISNKKPTTHEKPHTVSRTHWRELSDFRFVFGSFGAALKHEIPAFLALIVWALALIFLVSYVTKKLNVL
jgi:ABC-2 type transport system permease protein